jgi:hypothetical protein
MYNIKLKFKRPLSLKVIPLIRPDFRSTEKVKYYKIASSNETIPLLRPLSHCRREKIFLPSIL